MCGIIGIVADQAAEYIKPLNYCIRHRGPDDSGTYSTDNLSFGHQRLSIQDLSPNGHQPMFSADGRYVLIFNGEIYNHQAIRANLVDKYPFKSSSDTETVLYGFAAYGVELFNQLNGIFALAIYDHQTQDLVIARDQFGIKPLYYYAENNTLLFSSELKAIKDFPAFDKRIDYTALVNYIHFLWSPGAQTPFLSIKKLLPGHFIKANLQRPEELTIEKYYEIPFHGKYSNASEAELISELDNKLTAAVARQLLSDVPVGFFLSGGLDSSLIVALAAKVKGNSNFNCYTIKTSEADDFEGFTNDLHYARKVAAHLGVNLIEVDAPVEIVRDFDKMIWHLDEPQADAAPLNVLNISKLARENGDVVLLGGTAGDDLFSGYRRHQALQFEPYFQLIPPFFGKLLKQLSLKLNSSTAFGRRVQKLLRNIDQLPEERRAAYYQWIDLNINKKLFHPDLQAQLATYQPQQILHEALKNIPLEKNTLNQLLFWEMKYFLTDHNLNYTDKLSMAVGVEVRVPFLDKELVEFSTTIPPELKLKGKTTKYILKKVAEQYLPKEVIYRPKSGFGAPVRKWINHQMESIIDQYLSKEAIQQRGIFDATQVRQLIADNKNGKIDAAYTIWSLLAIESWFRQFVD